MATHSSILVWRIPWTEESGVLQSMGLLRVGHDWATEQQQQQKVNTVASVVGAGFVTSFWRILLGVPVELNGLKHAETPLLKSLQGITVAHSWLHSELVHFFPPILGTETVTWVVKTWHAINSPLGLCMCAESCLTLWDPMNCSPPGSSAHGILSSKNTGAGCHFLLQGIFSAKG